MADAYRPLPSQAQARALLGSQWDDFVERPIGESIEAAVANDLVRGIIATDALIGTFAEPTETSLRQNRCLLYHLIGGGTGHWDVPVGGMGTITTQLIGSARRAGAKLLTGTEVIAITPDGEVTWARGDAEFSDGFDLVLMGAAPSHLDRLCGSGLGSSQPEGAQVKANLLLTRLPRLRDAGVSAEAAFGGTLHVNEGYGRLAAAYHEASAGRVPHPLPCEIYCHSLADPTILAPDLRERGWHTLTVFGLQVPHALVDAIGNDALRARLTTAVLSSLDGVLGEPIEPLLALDGDGAPCLEMKTTRDLEDTLAMPGGQIFHGHLSWPWADADDPLDTPARRWGVATDYPRILICGAGARRGGGVSGVGGHNAAMAALELLAKPR